MTTQTMNAVRAIDDYYTDTRRYQNDIGRFYRKPAPFAHYDLTTPEYDEGGQMAQTKPDSARSADDDDKFIITNESALEEAFSVFMNWFKRDFSQKSCETYQFHFRVFLRWLNEEEHIAQPHVSDFRASVLEKYLEYNRQRVPARRSICHKDGKLPELVSNNTVRAAFHCLTALGKWLVRKRVLKVSPMTTIDLPKKDYSVKRPYATEAEMVRLLDEIKREPDIKKRTLWLAIEMTLANSAMRVSEVCKALIADLDENNGVIYIDAKGHKLKSKVPYYFGEATAQALRDWKAIRPAHDGGLLFCHDTKRPVSDEHIRKTITMYATKAEIENVKGLMPHGQKHMIAIRLSEEMVPLADIAKRLQHTKVTTSLQWYVESANHTVVASRMIEAKPSNHAGNVSNVVAPQPVVPEPPPQSATEPLSQPAPVFVPHQAMITERTSRTVIRKAQKPGIGQKRISHYAEMRSRAKK